MKMSWRNSRSLAGLAVKNPGFVLEGMRLRYAATVLALVAPTAQPADVLPRTVPLPFPYLPTEGMTTSHHMNLPDDFMDMLKKDATQLRHGATAGSFKDDKGTTWWQPRKSKRRYSIEQMIEIIGRLDFPGGLPDYIHGAEYWVQDKRGDNEGGFHYDKDESAASNQQRMIFPSLSTVTYLSDGGGPTTVFNQTTNQFGNDEVPAIPVESWLSFPKVGKHLAFNGHAQHGVSGSMCQTNCEAPRLVLLINWWDHTPEPPNCVRLPNDQVKSLGMHTITKERLKEIKTQMGSKEPGKGVEKVVVVEMEDTISTKDTHNIEFSLPPVDVVRLAMPTKFDNEVGKTIHVNLPHERASMIGEIDAHKYTQQAHIKHSDIPVLWAFVDREMRPQIDAVLRPLQMRLWTGGVARQHLEMYMGDTSNPGTRGVMRELGVERCDEPLRGKKKRPCIVLKQVPAGTIHTMADTFSEEALLSFLAGFGIENGAAGLLRGCLADFDELAKEYTAHHASGASEKLVRFFSSSLSQSSHSLSRLLFFVACAPHAVLTFPPGVLSVRSRMMDIAGGCEGACRDSACGTGGG